MKEILIINLTRMGDLLQTTPLMAGFKEAYPGVRITLVINSSFVEICKGIPFIGDLIVFDMHGFRDRLLQKEHSLVENYKLIESLINRINEKEYDLALNLTHSPISALIISLIRAREIRGFTIDSEGHRVIRHPWLRYFFNVVPNRDYNPFHLVDMYLKAGGVMPQRKGLIFEIPEDGERKSEELLTARGISGKELMVGIHLGASKSDKTWPVSSFAALADMITEESGAKILLFGSPSEADLGREFEMKVKARPINFIGQTSIAELSTLLRKCLVLISNDTGPLHLATAVGTRVIDIFTANVHFLETGPYGEGHYVIQADLPCVPCAFNVQCNNMVCKDLIRPLHVFEIAKEIIHGNFATAVPDPHMFNNVQIYQTHFKDDGSLGFYPLLRKPLNKEIIYRILYSGVWNRKLSRNADRVYNEVCRELSSCYALDNIDEVVISLGSDIKVLEKFSELANEGQVLAGLIAEEAGRKNPDVEKLKRIWVNLETLDNKIEVLGHTNPCFRPFTIFFAYSKEALEGNDLLKLSADTCGIYEDLLTGSVFMLQLMRDIKLFLEAATKPLNGKLNVDQIRGTEYSVY